MTSYESRKTVHHIICLTPVIRCTDGDGGGGGGGGQRGRMCIPDSIYRTPAVGGGGGGLRPLQRTPTIKRSTRQVVFPVNLNPRI